jgi:hypothetical protein
MNDQGDKHDQEDKKKGQACAVQTVLTPMTIVMWICDHNNALQKEFNTGSAFIHIKLKDTSNIGQIHF